MPVKFIKSHKRVACGLLSLAVFSFSALYPAQTEIVHADSDGSTINVNVSDGITIRVLDSTASSDLEELAFDFVPTDAGVSATKNAVVEVATSNETGYKLYVQSDWREDNTSSVGAYVDTESTAPHTTSLIHSGATSIPAVTDKIPTNLGTSYPYWYYYNDYYSEDKVIPAFGNPDKLAELDKPTDSDQTTVPITVGVDTSIVAGTYRNKLVFTAVSNPVYIDYSLSFSGNGGSDNVTYLPDTLSATTTAQQKTFTVPDNHALRREYHFLGWSEDENATTPDYVAGDTYTILADDQAGTAKTLYAVWENATYWNIEYMQEMTTAVCSGATKPLNTAGKTTAYLDTTGTHAGDANYVAQRSLYDIRDHKSYTVRKLADGNCWMTDNLAYELYSGGTYLGSKNDRSTFSWSPQYCPGGYGCGLNGNTATIGGRWYYTWIAATAEVGDRYTTTDVDGSICPVGWKLPYAYIISANQSFGGLAESYGISVLNHISEADAVKLDSLPLTFERHGWYDVTTTEKIRDSNGQWLWTSTAYANDELWAYRFYYRNDAVAAQDVHSKGPGLNIRCVAL